MSIVVVVNPFEVPMGMEDAAVSHWDEFATYFSKQPGYVSARLCRALSPDARFLLVTFAEWESTEHFMAALGGPEVQALAARAPKGLAFYPGVYEVIRG